MADAKIAENTEDTEVQVNAEGESDGNVKVPIMVHVPAALKVILEQKSEEQNVPLTAFARKILADAVGYTLLATQLGRARKYNTAEEREAAQKQRNSERRELINALLAKYRAGEIKA